MALVRLAIRNLSQRTSSSVSSVASTTCVGKQRWNDESSLKRFLTTASDHKVAGGETSDGKEVAVKEGASATTSNKSKLFPRRKGKRGRWHWRRINETDIVPALYEFFPSGLGNGLLQATDIINKLFQNLSYVSPSNLIGRVKEKDECYKLRYEVPGVSKEELKITIDDGVLTIKGEHKEEEEEEGSDDEFWTRRSYGYYNTSVVLPGDAKADGVKAELKDGVLYITIPRTEKPGKDVKEINVH